MTGFLRFVGLLNIATWLGGGIMFTLVIGPGVFSPGMHELLGGNNFPYYSGAIAQILVHRYFRMQLACGVIALLHLLVERLYLGKAWQQLWVSLLVALLALGLLGAFVAEPKIKQLHTTKYAKNASPEAQQAASQSLKTWHAGSQFANLLMLCGLGAYLWHLANPPESTRFLTTPKFRS